MSAPIPATCRFSNIKQEGFQNKMATLLGEAMGASVTYSWRPFIERGLTRQTFDAGMCDVMFDMPANYGRLLTTFPDLSLDLCACLSQRQGS